MYARGVGLRPETIEAVEWIRREDPHCELDPEDIVWVADEFGACADAVLLLSRLLMSCDDLDYVLFSKRYDLGPMVIWSRETARAVLATGLPLDGAEFRDVYRTALSPDDLYWIGYGGLNTGMPEISEARDVLGLMQDCPSVEQSVEQPLQRAA